MNLITPNIALTSDTGNSRKVVVGEGRSSTEGVQPQQPTTFSSTSAAVDFGYFFFCNGCLLIGERHLTGQGVMAEAAEVRRGHGSDRAMSFAMIVGDDDDVDLRVIHGTCEKLSQQPSEKSYSFQFSLK